MEPVAWNLELAGHLVEVLDAVGDADQVPLVVAVEFKHPRRNARPELRRVPGLMPKPWMTEPKPGELVTEDWLHRETGAKPQTVGKPCHYPEFWLRPDPDHEFADEGDIIHEDWLFQNEDGTVCAPHTYTIGCVINASTACFGDRGFGWLRPRHKPPSAPIRFVATDEYQRMLEFLSRGQHVDEDARKRAWKAWEVE